LFGRCSRVAKKVVFKEYFTWYFANILYLG
jgi:hypothetical protein